MRVASIRTRRLELKSISPRVIAALLAGRRAEAQRIARLNLPADWPGQNDERFLRLRLQQMRDDPSVQPWLLRAVVLREPRHTVVGYINFHGKPASPAGGPDGSGAAELGYAVFPPFRRRGYATEAIRAMMDWAFRGHGVRRFVASISPGNAPSLTMAAKLGFRQVGSQMDEVDGLELVFELAR